MKGVPAVSSPSEARGSAASGVIHDIGYRPYAGRRLGDGCRGRDRGAARQHLRRHGGSADDADADHDIAALELLALRGAVAAGLGPTRSLPTEQLHRGLLVADRAI